jgi:hypothetical protein
MLSRKVFHYDNKHSLTTFCTMGSNTIMDKYFKFIDFIWIILWISYNIAYWPFSNMIHKRFSFKGKSQWYCSYKRFDYRKINNISIDILFIPLYDISKTSCNHFASFTIHSILLVLNQRSFGLSIPTPHNFN